MVLYLLCQRRRIRIILLHSVIRAQRKEDRLWAITSHAFDTLDCRYRLASNMFRSYIPRPSFPVSLVSHITLGSDLDSSTNLDIMKVLTYPSENCKILPFFDQAHQCSPGSTLSLLFKIRKVFGVSLLGGLETLQTRRSPSTLCVASMSDLCFVEEACQTKFATGERERAAVRVCRIVKEG